MYDDYNGIPRNPMAYGMLALLCGALGTIIVFLIPNLSLIAAALGAVGMIVGGFAIGVANRFPGKERMQYMVISAAGIMLSVIAFMFGFVNFLT